jgi:hypothetical protein
MPKNIKKKGVKYMEKISKLVKKIESRGYWAIIIESLGGLSKDTKNLVPRDKYHILQTTNVQYRGWPVPYFPNIGDLNQNGEFVKISENISGGIDWEHYKQIFTLFQSGQFVLISGVSEDWVDESERLQMSELNSYKEQKILSFVSTTYYFTEVFIFISKFINSDLFQDVSDFHVKFSLKNTNNRTLKMFGANRVEFFKDYTSTAGDIKIYNRTINSKTFAKTWKKELLNSTINFYKYFGDYVPNSKVIESDIDNLLERKY